MNAQREPMVTFIDVADSLGLYRRLGDDLAHRTIAAALTRIETRLARHGGAVVKRIGDAVLCLFDDCAAGVPALADVHECASLTLRIGAHVGTVLTRAGDVFGDTVNLASRFAAIARPREILLSEAVAERLPPVLRARCRPVERLRLKGQDSVESLYQFRWDDSNATRVNSAISITAVKVRGELCLETPAGSIRLLPGERYRIGRDSTCDLVLEDARVSRFHATLEWRHGRCVLRDHSTNGSFVQPVDQTRAVFVRREDIPLAGVGRVSFAALDAGSTLDFHYE